MTAVALVCLELEIGSHGDVTSPLRYSIEEGKLGVEPGQARTGSPEGQLAYEKVTMKPNRTTGQQGQRCSGYFVPHYMMATRTSGD